MQAAAAPGERQEVGGSHEGGGCIIVYYGDFGFWALSTIMVKMNVTIILDMVIFFYA